MNTSFYVRDPYRGVVFLVIKKEFSYYVEWVDGDIRYSSRYRFARVDDYLRRGVWWVCEEGDDLAITLKSSYISAAEAGGNAIEKVMNYLLAIHKSDSIDMLNSALLIASYDDKFKQELLNIFWMNTSERYTLFAKLYDNADLEGNSGRDYRNALYSIDTACMHIRNGDDVEAVKDYNFLHNT
jgi:hypothetical protein